MGCITTSEEGRDYGAHGGNVLDQDPETGLIDLAQILLVAPLGLRVNGDVGDDGGPKDWGLEESVTPKVHQNDDDAKKDRSK